MALTASSLTASGSTTDANSFTTASISPAGNSLLVLWVVQALTGGATVTGVSSAGLSLASGWAQQKTLAISSSTRLDCWTAPCGASPGSGAVTISLSGTVGSIVWDIDAYADPAGVPAVVTGNIPTGGPTTSTAASVTYAAAASPSNLFGYCCGAAGFVTQLPAETVAWTELADQEQATPSCALETQVSPDTSVLTGSSTLSSSVAWATIGIEIAAAPVPAGGAVQAMPGRAWLRRFHHRQVPQQAPAAASAVALAETGTADDSSFAVAAAAPLAETGTAADTLAVTVAVPLADSGSGADTLAVSAAVPLAESGAGTETLATGSLVALAEAGTGADTLSATAAVPLAEAGTGADALAASAAVPLAESGTGADALSVSVAVPLAEGGTGADTLSVAAGGTPALAESGTGADALSVSAAVPLPEAATGTDTFLGVRQVAQAETGSGTDTVALSAAVPLAEGGSGAQALGALAQAALTEAGAALDTLSVATVLPFTVGALTASDTPGAALTAAAASSTLTAATAAQAALTAADQRTGGPGG